MTSYNESNLQLNRSVQNRLLLWILFFLASLVLAPTLIADALVAEDASGKIVKEFRVPSPDELGEQVFATASRTHLRPPPPDPEVGDSWLWWLFYHFPMPPHFEQKSCTVRAKTDHLYVVVEDSQWGVVMNQGDVDAIVERWEYSSLGPFPDQGIYSIDTAHFGDPPDTMDDDPRIYLVYFDISYVGDGFFFWWDLFPDGYNPPYPSNECEVLYLNPVGASGGHSAGDDYMMAVAAHEFEHLIHFARDEDEEVWVDEGLAELAMWLFGNPDTISGFNTNPDIPLAFWPLHGESSYPHYIKTYLWTLYFYERYGGQNGVLTLIEEEGNSIAGYEQALDDLGYTADVADVFADWAVANYLDDTEIADGRYGYLGEDLPPFSVSGNYSSYPVDPVNATVNNFATDYYRFHSLENLDDALRIEFNGADSGLFSVRALLLRDDATTEISDMPLNDQQDGALSILSITGGNAEVIMVVAKVNEAGNGTYQFSAFDSPTAVDEGGAPLVVKLHPVHPNPFNPKTTILFDLASAAYVRIAVCNPSGRHVASLMADNLAAGRHEIAWDGTDDSGLALTSGVYLVLIDADGYRSSQRAVLIK